MAVANKAWYALEQFLHALQHHVERESTLVRLGAYSTRNRMQARLGGWCRSAQVRRDCTGDVGTERGGKARHWVLVAVARQHTGKSEALAWLKDA